MKAGDIQVGKTYCNKTGNSAREVLEIHRNITPELRETGTIVAEKHVSMRWVDVGDTAVIYLQKRGSYIGTLDTLSLKSFAAWANREDGGMPPSRGLDRIAQGVTVAKALEDLVAQIDEIIAPELAKSLTKLDEARKLLKEIKE